MVRLSADDPGHPPEALASGSRRGSSPCYAADSGTVVFVEERPRSVSGDAPHTFDGRYEIATIDLTVVYFVPRDRRPLVDWRDRVDYFGRRIAAFHQRESGGRSTLRIHVHPEPLIAARTSDEIRGKDPTRRSTTRPARLDRPSSGPGNRTGFRCCSS